MKLTSLLLAASLTAAPAYAGGPVVIEDEYDVAEPAPSNDWIVPVIIGGLILCAIACGGDDDSVAAPDPVKPPGPICFDDGC